MLFDITYERINALFDEEISTFQQNLPFTKEVSKAFNLSDVELIETIEKIRSQWLNDPNISKDLHNSYLLDCHSDENNFIVDLASYLMQFAWFIFESKADDIILTSDSPGFCIDNEKVYSTKFDGTFEFIYPLNSNNFLMISNKFKDKEPLKELKKLHCSFATSTVINKLNRCTFALADEEVYACRRIPLYSTWKDYRRFINH